MINFDYKGLTGDVITKEDFEYKVGIKNGCEKVLSMDVKGPFVRKRRDVVLEVKDGIVQPSQIQDAAMVSVIERFGRNGNKSLAFCSGWNLKRGAMASTAAPDDNNLIVMDLQSTPLKGVVRSSEDGLFYLFPIQSLSTLQEMKGHLTCAIDVLSNPDENDTEKRLDAVRTLNSLVAALSVNDGDHYDVIDTAFEEIRE